MDNHLESLSDRIRESFERKTEKRDKALAHSRELTRHAARAIRAIHRNEASLAHNHLAQAKLLAEALRNDLADEPDLYYSGYTQDALKEYCEAHLTVTIILNEDYSTPEDLQVSYATYLNGLSEAVGELRRRIMDLMRTGHSLKSNACWIIWTVSMHCWSRWIILMPLPMACAAGLILPAASSNALQADVTISYRQQLLENRIADLSDRLSRYEMPDEMP